MINEEEISAVSLILSRWNPLGSRAAEVHDLEGYRTEAIDIISIIGLKGSTKADAIIREVLNQAFDLSLSTADCSEPAKQIRSILKNKN
jgi:hypothetical protein